MAPVFALLFPLFALQTAPEPAPAETPPSAQQRDVVVTAPQRTVCRDRGVDMGSNIRRRTQICQTEEEAAAEAELQEERVEEAFEGFRREENGIRQRENR